MNKRIDEILQGLQLPLLGREYVKRVASSTPSRRVRSNSTNVICRFPSKKMGVTIQAESHSCELALIYALDHDPDVIGFWDQPEPIKISYLSATGRNVSTTITPDFLVLRGDGLELIEAKLVEALPELAKEMPNRFVLGDDGKWHSPPAETTARVYGIRFRIWTPSEVDPTWLRNIKFLQDYFGADLNLVPAEVKNEIVEVASSELGISLADLRQRCQTATADQFYLLLAHEELYVDLAAAPLTDPTRVRVFACRAAADTYSSLIKKHNADSSENGAASGSNEVTDPQLGETAMQLLRKASPEDHAVANHRLRILFDLEYAQTGENLGRPWLSILMDGFSRRILAFCLTFDPPSYPQQEGATPARTCRDGRSAQYRKRVTRNADRTFACHGETGEHRGELSLADAVCRKSRNACAMACQ